MFKRFYDDLTYLPRRKFSIKYTLPFITTVLAIAIAGQIIIHFFPLNQLRKESGKLTDSQIKIDYWSRNRGSSRSHAVYSLFITLDDTKIYKVQNENYMYKVDSAIHRGDLITVYYPTLLYRILSLGLARDISQIEANNKIVYDYNIEKNDSLLLAGVFTVLFALFYYLLYFLRKYDI